MIGLITIWQADKILVEKAMSGHALFDDLFYTERYRGKVIKITPKFDKAVRVEAATAELETGKFLLPKEAVWLSDFEYECRLFPAGRHDDQVDSLVQFVNWQKAPRSRTMLNRKPAGRVVLRKMSLRERIQEHYRNFPY